MIREAGVVRSWSRSLVLNQADKRSNTAEGNKVWRKVNSS